LWQENFKPSLTQEIADALKKSRFRNIRMAWDWFYSDPYKIWEAIKMLRKAGYKNNLNLTYGMFCEKYLKCCDL
jgi:hypothetical protein